MQSINQYLKNTYLALSVALVATFFVYLNSIPNGFVIEDPIYITNWKLTQNLGNIPNIFTGDTAPTGNYGIYRPLRAMFYALDFAFFGGANPMIYHIQALLVHLIITALVFLVALEIFSVIFRDLQSSIFNYKTLAVIAGLLFGLHPVHTEPVDYLTANFDAISYIFFFASFYFYLKATKPLDDFKFSLSLSYYILSVIFASLAFFHFEMTLTLPLLLIFYDFCFRQYLFKKVKWEKLFKLYGPFFISAAIFLFIRVVLLHMNVRGEYLGGSFYLTMLTMVKSIIKYLILLVFPLDLSINPTIADGISSWVHPLARTDKILSQTIFDKEIIFSLVIIGGLIAAAIKVYRQYPVLTFGIGWFFISILPVLYIIPQGPILQERYIYLASFGFVLLLTFGFNYLLSYNFGRDLKEYAQYGLYGILILIIGFYGFRTFTRNFEWKDSFAVWSTLAKQSPQDVIANFSTGKIYAEKNQFDQAIKHYNQALAVEQRLHEVHFGLGEIYMKTGNLDQAAVHYQQALTINPDYSEAKDKIKKLNQDDKNALWNECKIGETLVFSCPDSWSKFDMKDGLKVSDIKSNLTIELSIGTWDTNKPPEDFVKSDTSTSGNLVNQGLANFLNADITYVKVFQIPNPSNTREATSSATQAAQKLQFFLFKGDKVIKILVSPVGDPQQMIKFDRFVSSIQFIKSK